MIQTDKTTKTIFPTQVLLGLLVVCCLCLFTSCKKDKSDENTSVMPTIIYDTDIGSSTDDLFGLEMLNRYHDQGRCRLLGVVVDREGENCAACADVMNTYFGHGDIPIALVRNGIKNPMVWIDYQGLADHTLDDGSKMFQRSVNDYSALPDGWQLYRRLLASQPDKSVSIVSVGFVTCLSQLLESEPDAYSVLNGVDLVRQKVKCLYIQGGRFGEAEEGDFNFAQGIGFAQTFFRLWPNEVDIIFNPMETGQSVEYAPEQVIADIDWTDTHPIKQVYLKYNCDTGQKMWDAMSVINAVEGDDLFYISERGTVGISLEAETPFTPSSSGNCRYLKPGDAIWSSEMLERIRTLNKIQ